MKHIYRSGCGGWLPTYNRRWLRDDLAAAAVVSAMLVPQSLAYALLAGMPPETGLYASIVPILAYAIFGSSRTLAVGPVALASLMSASAASNFAQGNPELFYAASLALALIGGVGLFILGLLKAGFVANLLSHPVVSGFVSASALLIAIGQLGPMLGISASGATLQHLVGRLIDNLSHFDASTLLVGGLTLAWILAVRRWSPSVLIARLAPVVAVVAGLWCVDLFSLSTVKTLGAIQGGLPSLGLPHLDAKQWGSLVLPGMTIALVGFVETLSVGHALAAKRKQRIEPNSELLGLGAANIASGLSGGFAVTGGFSRSAVNHDAGAQTPMAGVFTAGAILLISVFAASSLESLPQAVLSATVLVAVSGLVDLRFPVRLWQFSRRDFLSYAITVASVLFLGVELGILLGVAASTALLLAFISRPHWAITGQVDGTEHFRNILRHAVNKSPGVVSLRIDESLWFPNARWVEELLLTQATAHDNTHFLVLQCSAINHIDASGIEALQAADENLKAMGIELLLSEVKGPVEDQLKIAPWIKDIRSRIYMTHLEAVRHAESKSLQISPRGDAR